MCALILLHRRVPEFPVVLAANRDESFARAAEPPHAQSGRIPWVGPLDLVGGGTWIGTNAAGVVAALTNRRAEPDDAALPSRGALVREALTCGSAAAARVHLRQWLSARAFNAYHLLVVDAYDAFVIAGGRGADFRRLEPGTHVITNLHALGELSVDAVQRVATEAVDAPLIDSVTRLIELLRTRAELAPGFTPNKDLGDRGTRSATIIARGEPGRPGMFLHADGPPDRTPFEDYGGLLRALAP